MDTRMDGRMNGWMNERKDGRTEGWTDGGVNATGAPSRPCSPFPVLCTYAAACAHKGTGISNSLLRPTLGSWGHLARMP